MGFRVTWEKIYSEGIAEVYLATTNNFSNGKGDIYRKMGTVNLSKGKFLIETGRTDSKFFKVLVKAPHNWMNRWIKI